MSSITSPTKQFTPKTHSSPTVLLTDAELSEPSQSDVLKPDASLPSSIRQSRGSMLSSSMPNQVPNNLRIGVVNINAMRGKRAELAELVNSTWADILVITETKIDNTMKISEFLPRHFDGSIHRNRNAHGGGVMLVMKKGIIAEEIELEASKSGEITCTKIHLAKANPLYVCAYYRPPSDATESLDNLESALEELNTIIARNTKSGIIRAGDFNTRDIHWDKLVLEPQCTKKSLCRPLQSILGEVDQHQLERSTTREDAILDLFCMNTPGIIKNIDTILGISDHDGVIIIDTAVRAQFNKKTQWKVPIWKRADWETMKKKTTTFGDKFLADHEQHTVEKNWTKYHDLIGEHIGSIRSRLTSSRNNFIMPPRRNDFIMPPRRVRRIRVPYRKLPDKCLTYCTLGLCQWHNLQWTWEREPSALLELH